MVARIKIEDIIDHLNSEIRKALRDAVLEVMPNAQFDEYNLFRAFKRSIRRKCHTWESVPDNYIEVD